MPFNIGFGWLLILYFFKVKKDMWVRKNRQYVMDRPQAVPAIHACMTLRKTALYGHTPEKVTRNGKVFRPTIKDPLWRTKQMHRGLSAPKQLNCTCTILPPAKPRGLPFSRAITGARTASTCMNRFFLRTERVYSLHPGEGAAGKSIHKPL